MFLKIPNMSSIEFCSFGFCSSIESPAWYAREFRNDDRSRDLDDRLFDLVDFSGSLLRSSVRRLLREDRRLCFSTSSLT